MARGRGGLVRLARALIATTDPGAPRRPRVCVQLAETGQNLSLGSGLTF